MNQQQDSRDYFQQREQVERLAAQNASCDAARRAHEELAEFYSEMLKRP